MKNIVNIGMLFILLMGIISSCNSEKKTESKEVSSHETKHLYGLKPELSMLRWTAYKTTKKIGVSGTFDSISIECQNTSGTIKELLENAKITINTASVNSNNKIRDPKIVKFFFGNLSIPSKITGFIESVSDNKVHIVLTMNGLKKTVISDFSIANKMLNINTIINLTDWNAQSSLSALNKECEDLHKDIDGISRLWPEVAIDILCPIEELR